MTPCLAASDRANASLGRAAQLAEPVLSFVEGLRQGLPMDESIRPKGQSAGVREKEVESRGDWEIRSRFFREMAAKGD